MGMKKMFSNQAEFNELLDSNEQLQVSDVVHKAFIEVNEEGAEAAAATGRFHLNMNTKSMFHVILFCIIFTISSLLLGLSWNIFYSSYFYY